jgi:hypothetical protein
MRVELEHIPGFKDFLLFNTFIHKKLFTKSLSYEIGEKDHIKSGRAPTSNIFLVVAYRIPHWIQG